MSISAVPLNFSTGVLSQECVPEWDQNSTTVLIQMYKERKYLWDATHEFYKNRKLRRGALTEMANHFNCSLADVEKKLYMLRSSFRKEYRRWNYAKLSAGSNNATMVRKPQWFALDLLMFLKDDVANKSLSPLNHNETIENNVNQDLVISNLDVHNVFYYDSENSILTPLEPGEVAPDYNIQHQIPATDSKQSPDSSLKRSANNSSALFELPNKRQNLLDSDDSRMGIAKSTTTDSQERDAYIAFGNFVTEELKNIKDPRQVQLAKLRIHQILFDATRSFLKVPVPRL